MTVARATNKGFSAERLLAPRGLALVGAETPEGARVLANIQAADFAGTLHIVGQAQAASCADVPQGLDVAVLALSGLPAIVALRALAARAVHAVIATAHVPYLAETAASLGVRLLGPNSFGLFAAKLGLNASMAHIPPPPGRVALLTQSASFARAVLDWAGPNGVGFSHIVGIGENTDIGFGTLLDVLSRDPDTGLILLDIRQVRARRAFISAARAASRLRPVVAIRPGGRLLDPSGQSDAVFAAALNRAGVFTVSGMEAFLAAAETLSRARPARNAALAIVTNAIGPGRLAADAALQAGIGLAILPQAAQTALPAELTQGLVYAGSAAPVQVADLAAMLSAVPEVGGVLVLLAPTGAGDAAAVEAVIAAASVARLPVLTCVMGETTAAAHRGRIAQAGFPAFATPEQAVSAFHHLLRARAARLAARELPPSQVLDLAPDHAACRAALHAALGDGRQALSQAEGESVCAAYGIARDLPFRITVHEDGVFGPAIGLHLPGAAPAYDLPPLNLPLARALARSVSDTMKEQAADTLVCVSQLIVDEPCIAAIELSDRMSIQLHGTGERGPLAIPPYPEELAETWNARGVAYTIRPIRPEDAAAHADFIRRVPPEDIRYRFFTAMREVAPEHMARLTQIDYEREMAFIAVRTRDAATVGVARLVREIGAGSGEFAVLVEPDAKGMGLASHLMRRIIAWGRAQGLTRMTGQVLADNHPMRDFVRHLGFTLSAMPGEPDVMEARLDLPPT